MELKDRNELVEKLTKVQEGVAEMGQIQYMLDQAAHAMAVAAILYTTLKELTEAAKTHVNIDDAIDDADRVIELFEAGKLTEAE